MMTRKTHHRIGKVQGLNYFAESDWDNPRSLRKEMTSSFLHPFIQNSVLYYFLKLLETANIYFTPCNLNSSFNVYDALKMGRWKLHVGFLYTMLSYITFFQVIPSLSPLVLDIWRFLFFIYWGIVALQRCASFCCTVKWISHTYTFPTHP